MEPEEPSSPKEVAIESKKAFTAIMDALGSEHFEPTFKKTHDNKYFAFLDIEIQNQRGYDQATKNRVYSYFHDTKENAEKDVYQEAVTWAKSEFKVVIDEQAEKQLIRLSNRAKGSEAWAKIMEDRYVQTKQISERLKHKKMSAINTLLAMALKSDSLLFLAKNTTPLKPGSIEYPHMVYTGPQTPTTQEQSLAQCVSEVFSILRLD